MLVAFFLQHQAKQFITYLVVPMLIVLTACGGSSEESEPPRQNTAPSINISTPSDNSSFEQNETVAFTASATDTEDANISSSISWSSSIDGSLGIGASVSTTLTIGEHTITASVTDSGSLSDTQSVSISIIQTNPGIGAISDSNNATNETAEYAEAGALVGLTLLAIDTGDTVTYSLTDNSDGRFSVNSSSGVVMVANGELLEASNNASHNIQALAQSSDGSSSNASFTITVINDGCPVKPGQTSSATYTISWDAISDSDLMGFTIYYGDSENLDKPNAQGTIDVVGNVTNTIFVPGDLNISSCTQTYIAVASNGERPESVLSDVQSIFVE